MLHAAARDAGDASRVPDLFTPSASRGSITANEHSAMTEGHHEHADSQILPEKCHYGSRRCQRSDLGQIRR